MASPPAAGVVWWMLCTMGSDHIPPPASHQTVSQRWSPIRCLCLGFQIWEAERMVLCEYAKQGKQGAFRSATWKIPRYLFSTGTHVPRQESTPLRLPGWGDVVLSGDAGNNSYGAELHHV